MFNRTAFIIATAVLSGVATSSSAQSSASPVASFDARAAKHRGGVYFTLDDIQKRSPARLSDLFRSLSGITLSTNDAGKIVLTSSRGGRTSLTGAATTSGITGAAPQAGGAPPPPTMSGGRCAVLVGMDGQMMDASFSVDDIPVTSVHGIEVYTGSARVPVEFGAANDSGCGVVMVWSKTGTDKP
jgi:hypothetical protein